MPTCLGSLCVIGACGVILVGFMIVLGIKSEGER